MNKYKDLKELLTNLKIKDLKIAFFTDNDDKYFITVVRDVNGQDVYKMSDSYNTLDEASIELIQYFNEVYNNG